ncbi:bifunctional riboflavin kinase/FAD synthetase [Pedobacter cryophilus]|uniref:Riboflavin biosynthesis protein n=1 Tax=Pedobacter cryophilus TaxID=2571271 RepID=A0A4V5NXK2_9SPHI|nr:bifunctional riboflavin kinase/FAD synthetase [Pedobacter cryophilus]TKB98553.1 bifunctional riboflavin kinase/FAD synthetase [Pedobacter cryophilus]
MQIYHHIKDFERLENAVVTIGTFDGVHLGHQKIITKLIEKAHQIKGESVILTFFPHPRMILHPEDHELKMINTIAEKALLLEQLGVDHLIITPFTRDFSNQNAEQYIKEILINQIGMKGIVIGYDHRFGKDRSGGLKELQQFSPVYGYQINEIPEQDIADVAISSTRIRKALSIGDVDVANELMGHPFSLSGKVIRGDQIGRTLGYPTANLFIEESYKIIPSDGIYAVEIHIPEKSNKNKNQVIDNPFQLSPSDNQKSNLKNHQNHNCKFRGMAYIGHRPTINGMSQNIEVNIFDFNEDIYHESIRLDFLHFIRHDIKFEGLAKLTEQLAKDKISTLNYFENQTH